MNRSMSPLRLVCLSLCLWGCGGGGRRPELTPVSGTVSYKGSPLPGVNVTFLPESGPSAFATTDGEGKFSLQTNGAAGAVKGKHQISVAAAAIPPMPGTAEAKKTADLTFPAKYSNPKTSELTATIPTDSKPVELQLKD